MSEKDAVLTISIICAGITTAATFLTVALAREIERWRAKRKKGDQDAKM